MKINGVCKSCLPHIRLPIHCAETAPGATRELQTEGARQRKVPALPFIPSGQTLPTKHVKCPGKSPQGSEPGIEVPALQIFYWVTWGKSLGFSVPQDPPPTLLFPWLQHQTCSFVYAGPSFPDCELLRVESLATVCFQAQHVAVSCLGVTYHPLKPQIYRFARRIFLASKLDLVSSLLTILNDSLQLP